MRARNARNQSGVTLLETLIVMAISTILLGPVFGWAVSALKQQTEVRQLSADATSANLLSTAFPGDVLSANTVWTIGSSTVAADFATSDGSTTAPATTACDPTFAVPSGATVVAMFQTYAAPDDAAIGDSVRVIYWEQVVGGERSLYRQRCVVGQTVNTIDRLATNLKARSDVTCVAAATGATQAKHCLNITFTMYGGTSSSGAPVRVTASRKVSSVAVGVHVNRPPVPSIVVDTDQGNRSLTVHFDATATTDLETPQAQLQLAWNFDDGTTASGAFSAVSTVTHTFTYTDNVPQKTFTVRLDVTDGGGLLTPSYQVITVDDNPPTVLVDTVPDQVFRNTDVVFDASDTFDVDSSSVSFAWAFGGSGVSKSSSSAANAGAVRWTSLGAKSVTLTVTDTEGVVSTWNKTINVVNSAPTAVITLPKLSAAGSYAYVPLNSNFTFDASGSTDLETATGSLTYKWDWGDGTQPSTGVTPTHRYTSATQRTIRLTVTDTDGGNSNVTLVVLPITPQQPVARFTPATNTQIGAIQLFDGTPSSSPNGYIASWTWAFQRADTQPLLVTSNGSGPAYSRLFDPGVYKVQLSVTDNFGLTNSVTQDYVSPGKLKSPTITVLNSRTQSVQWSQVDGATGYQVTVTFTKNCSPKSASVSLSTSTPPSNITNCGGASIKSVSVIAVGNGSTVSDSSPATQSF